MARASTHPPVFCGSHNQIENHRERRSSLRIIQLDRNPKVPEKSSGSYQNGRVSGGARHLTSLCNREPFNDHQSVIDSKCQAESTPDNQLISALTPPPSISMMEDRHGTQRAALLQLIQAFASPVVIVLTEACNSFPCSFSDRKLADS